MSDFTNGAQECFCDRKYKDANKLASCGDCPRDYIVGAWDARRKYIEEHSKMTDRYEVDVPDSRGVAAGEKIEAEPNLT